jgi:hypothetical protein
LHQLLLAQALFLWEKLLLKYVDAVFDKMSNGLKG